MRAKLAEAQMARTKKPALSPPNPFSASGGSFSASA